MLKSDFKYYLRQAFATSILRSLGENVKLNIYMGGYLPKMAPLKWESRGVWVTRGVQEVYGVIWECVGMAPSLGILTNKMDM